MNKYDYLLQVFQHGAYRHKSWVIAATSIVQENLTDYQRDPYPCRLVQTPTGYSFVDPTNPEQLIPIEDAPAGQPLVQFKEPLQVDPRWAENITTTIDTTFGNALVNSITIADVFGKKLPYLEGKVTVDRVETLIASRLRDTPVSIDKREDRYIYVDEYLRYIDRLQYLASLSSVCVWSATRKNIVAPVGIQQYRDQLVKEYGDQLRDPSRLAEFEKKLRDYDSEYLKGDPSDGVFITGKVKNIARKKMYLSIGNESSFTQTTTATPIIQSLEEGWPTDPTEYTALMNGLRFGSFARGAETVNGGVTAKSLLRSLGSYTITMDDCGSSLGLTRCFTDDDYELLIDRYIYEAGKLVLVESDSMARAYIGRDVIMRSPLYCQSKAESFCRYCVGEKLASNPNGLSLAVTDVSAVILASFMKLMHGTVLASAHFDYEVGLT